MASKFIFAFALALLLALCSQSAHVVAAETSSPSLGSLMMDLALHDSKQELGFSLKSCAGCTLAVAVVEQLVAIHDKPVKDVLDMLCDILPGDLQPWCNDLVNQYADTLVAMLENKETPDSVCMQLKQCTNPACHLFPLPKHGVLTNFVEYPAPKPSKLASAKSDPLSWLIAQIKKVVDSHLPLVDLDHDKFSTIKTYRGTMWRGKDCNDLDATVYPGSNSPKSDSMVDHDCNGIYGTNPKTKKTFESELCDGTQPFGVAILGDSAAAHFHIPPDYLTPQNINKTTFKDLLKILIEEFDWPEMSSTTGFEEAPFIGVPFGPVHSFYQKMRQRNKCMHRDYQNIGVNGATVGSMTDIMHTLARNASFDKPMLAMYALIGNDVCKRSFADMTTPEQMYERVTTALNFLDSGVLPKGSQVVIEGIADGTVLYNYLHDHIHPIGLLRKDVTYRNLYDYLNCLEISPCWGWMNSNDTVRQLTLKRRDQLNAVLANITDTLAFNNFKVHYLGSPINDFIPKYVKAGGNVADLIEAVDGFHPSQRGNALAADYMWSLIEKLDILPPVNPNNEKITAIFGNQGGH